jgi:hypothetical protein
VIIVSRADDATIDPSCNFALDSCDNCQEKEHVLEFGNVTLSFGKTSATVCTSAELSLSEASAASFWNIAPVITGTGWT